MLFLHPVAKPASQQALQFSNAVMQSLLLRRLTRSEDLRQTLQELRLPPVQQRVFDLVLATGCCQALLPRHNLQNHLCWD